MEDIKIRFATEKDVDDIMKLLLQVHRVHSSIRSDIFKVGSTKYSADELKGIIADKNSPIVVAVDKDDRVLGYSFLQIVEIKNNRSLVDTKYIYIDDLCVDEGSRGKGIAKSILEEVKNYSKKLGCNSLRLNVWKGNDNALRFYEKMGFVELKREMEILL